MADTKHDHDLEDTIRALRSLASSYQSDAERLTEMADAIRRGADEGTDFHGSCLDQNIGSLTFSLLNLSDRIATMEALQRYAKAASRPAGAER